MVPTPFLWICDVVKVAQTFNEAVILNSLVFVNTFDKQILYYLGIADNILPMNEVQTLVNALVKQGWTVAAIADTLGVSWETVKCWQQGKHPPRAPQAIVMALSMLKSQVPPPKRRYGPDAPQRRPKKNPATDLPPG
jgi:hypothetical protein